MTHADALPEPAEVGTNWAGNVAYSGTRLYRPETIAEVQQIVRAHEKIKALGGRHSFSTIADTRGAMIALDRFDTVSDVDRAAGTVEVGAGVKYAQLCPQLLKQGFAVANLASLPHIAVVGACSTATHGSGTGNLATQVAGLELVDGRGDIVRLSAAANGDDFRGAVVGLGAIGVVTKVTLHVVPAFDVRQWVWDRLRHSWATSKRSRARDTAPPHSRRGETIACPRCGSSGAPIAATGPRAVDGSKRRRPRATATP